jgi:microcystin-dependent protein
VPQHWLADGLIHIRLTDSSGVPQVDTTMQVLGPSSGGGGGGGSVDPTSIIATGDIKARHGTGPLAGFVRGNGLTIGNATCGCSERANADTQNLFVYLYNADPNLSVSGGRTGNALNDFNASKQLTLPDWRGRTLAGLDDMGNSAAGRLTSTYFGTSATVLGAAGGAQSHTQTIAEMPAHTHNNTLTDPGHDHTYGLLSAYQVVGGTIPLVGTQGGPPHTSTSFTGITINNASAGTGNPFSVVNPMMLVTIYYKL